MRLLPLLLAALLLCPASPALSAPDAVLRLSGPPIVESLPLLVMAREDRPWEQDFEVRFLPWRSPDMLRAMVAGGQTDGAILTTAAACTLSNRGVPCRVAALMEPQLRIISTKPGSDTLDSLTGTLLFPFGPGEMPELLYRAAGGGIDGNVSVRHTGSSLEAVNLLLTGQADHALLSEPTASVALQRARSLRDRGGPPLTSRISMSQAWRRAFPGRALAATCVALLGPASLDAARVRAFGQAYAEACRWISAHPDEAFALARDRFPALAAQLDAQGASDLAIHILEGADARSDALFFLERIHDISPTAVADAASAQALFDALP